MLLSEDVGFTRNFVLPRFAEHFEDACLRLLLIPSGIGITVVSTLVDFFHAVVTVSAIADIDL